MHILHESLMRSGLAVHPVYSIESLGRILKENLTCAELEKVKFESCKKLSSLLISFFFARKETADTQV